MIINSDLFLMSKTILIEREEFRILKDDCSGAIGCDVSDIHINITDISPIVGNIDPR